VRMFNKQAGFTIVEVMIVAMILGILATLVLPSVRVNTVRVKTSEALIAFSNCRNSVMEIYNTGGEPPADGVWGCEIDKDASKYVDSVKVDPIGTITISLHGFGDLRLDFHSITMEPLDNTGSLPTGNGAPIRRWRCGNPVGTDVPSQYLPATCRG
jgi:type IV pilus assembly protein PilA